MQHKPYNFRPVPTINYARLKFTLILLALLSLGYYVKADTPCHVAITSYERQIDSLETRLATAQSVPYNQGYHEGYKVAKAEPTNNVSAMIITGMFGILLGFLLSLILVLKNID